jgi:hypothetical protein
MKKNILGITNNGGKEKIYSGDLRYYFRFLFSSAGNTNPYHNVVHSSHVVVQAYEGALYSSLPVHNVRPLLIAAMLHDVGHSGKMGNDDREIETAIFFLEEIILPEDKALLPDITSLIVATRYPHVEGDFSEAALILRDADLSQILADNWFDSCVLGLSQEMGLSLKETLNENIRFLRSLKFQSTWGKEVLQSKVVDRLHEVQYLYNFVY